MLLFSFLWPLTLIIGEHLHVLKKSLGPLSTLEIILLVEMQLEAECGVLLIFIIVLFALAVRYFASSLFHSCFIRLVLKGHEKFVL